MPPAPVFFVLPEAVEIASSAQSPSNAENCAGPMRANSDISCTLIWPDSLTEASLTGSLTAAPGVRHFSNYPRQVASVTFSISSGYNG